MPLYEYLCGTCGRFEVIRKFSDKALKKCPTCGKQIEKLASAPAFHLKGTGWYVTDYAKKSNGGDKGDKDKGDKKDSDSKKESDSNKKSDSGAKPDAGTASAKAGSDSSTSSSSSDSTESKSSTASKPASTSKKSPASGSSPT